VLRIQELGTWRYKTYAPTVPAVRKIWKIAFFAQCSHRLAESPLPPGDSSQKTQNWVVTHASPNDTLKAVRRFLGIFQETRKHHDLGLCRASWHTLQYKTIIKHVYTWRNYPNLDNSCSLGRIRTSLVPPLVQPWTSLNALHALLNSPQNHLQTLSLSLTVKFVCPFAPSLFLSFFSKNQLN